LITLKIPYKSNEEFQEYLIKLRKQYSSVVRFSYNRLKEGKSEKDIRSLHHTLNNVDEIDAWTKQCAVNEAKQILEKHKENKVIFGGKYNMIKYFKGLISKEEYKECRILPLNIYGEKANKGNRKFKLDLKNNKVTYKHNKNNHFELEIPNLRSFYKNLYKLQELNELDGYTYQVKLTDKHIYFTFDEFEQKIKLNEERYIGIDLNPEFIGISVKENDEILFTKLFSMKSLTDKIIGLKVPSTSKIFKNLNNKLNNEVLEISKEISKISMDYNCKFVFIEDLKFKDNTKANRKNKNLWKRNIFINNLKKRCNINGQVLFPINPAYSSFIGNCMFDYEDPINASLEIGRRGYNVIIKKNKKFYPELELKEELKSQWKDKFDLDSFKSWKELFYFTKNLKMRYRVSTDNVVFRKFKSKKSLIGYINH